ncbi:MAG: pyocin activator PrtN family protein [Laribacter sp.]|nr:pyocin activator PrtN family protein [Laribacter sp.]MBP9528330.1 pyocin activator PrtN family protein [Laribacter sp.]MBP9609351.1 pyocin activator PrtN family protein [Laribacter sp.]
MNTLFLLMAQYQKAVVSLNEISEEYLGMSPRRANELASANRLPLATFQLYSQKSPRMVHLSDLANWLDTQREAARKQWSKSQVS